MLTYEKTLYTLTTPKLSKDDSNSSASNIQTKEKWEEHNAWVKVLILHYMNDNIIPLYEDYETAKEIMDAIEAKYDLRSDTHI